MNSILISIENSLLVSVLEHDFVQNDKNILQINLNPEIFTDKINKLFVTAINRLKELNEPVNSDVMRIKFMKADKWNFIAYDEQLMRIIASNPFGTVDMFKSYLKVLEDEYMMNRVSV